MITLDRLEKIAALKDMIGLITYDEAVELVKLARLGLWVKEQNVIEFITDMQDRLDDSEESDEMWIMVNSIIESIPKERT